MFSYAAVGATNANGCIGASTHTRFADSSMEQAIQWRSARKGMATGASKAPSPRPRHRGPCEATRFILTQRLRLTPIQPFAWQLHLASFIRQEPYRRTFLPMSFGPLAIRTGVVQHNSSANGPSCYDLNNVNPATLLVCSRPVACTRAE